MKETYYMVSDIDDNDTVELEASSVEEAALVALEKLNHRIVKKITKDFDSSIKVEEQHEGN